MSQNKIETKMYHETRQSIDRQKSLKLMPLALGGYFYQKMNKLSRISKWKNAVFEKPDKSLK